MSVATAAATPRRPRLPLLVCLLALAATVAACAPAVGGTSSSSPLVVGSAPARVEQGKTYYLRFDLQLDQFKLAPRDLEAALWVPSGYNSEVGDVSSMFALHDTRAGAGWTVELLQVRATRTSVVTSASLNQSRVDYSLAAVLKVQVPDGIVPGPYRVRGDLQVRSGAKVPLAATLDVAAH